MDYTYNDIDVVPDETNIHVDVAGSAMADKTIQGCTWHKETEKLLIKFTGTLSGADKTILDAIVVDNT